jgi:hypothetical protein
MATLYNISNNRAASTFPAFTGGGGGNLCAAYGSYDFAVNPSIADVVEFCRLPKGAVVLGGWLRLEDIDSNATETFDMDIGTAADTDAFGNFGVRTGDAVTDYLPEGGALLPLHGTLKDGPVSITAETVVIGTIVAAAATFAAGTATVVVLYVTP